MYNDKRNKEMNKKRYTAPQMKTMKIETQGFIASSNPSLGRGKSGESGANEMPDIDEYGISYGD